MDATSPPILAIDAFDRTLVAGDRQQLSEFLEPYYDSLEGHPARIVYELADALNAYYIADTLAYLTRMLPQAEKRSGAARLLGPRKAGGPVLTAPDAVLMPGNPQRALQQWTEAHKQTGGALLLEARAIFRHLSVPVVLRSAGLQLPRTGLADVHNPVELPSSDYLGAFLDVHLPGATSTYVRDQREATLRQAFNDCWFGFAVRLFRVLRPDQVGPLEQVYTREGAEMAETMLRLSLPHQQYRRRRLEALAIYTDLVIPAVFAQPST